jgi:tetratricopeptide (TPR) repeat protein
LEEAIIEYKRAIELKADYAKAFSNLATVYLDLDKPDLAIHCECFFKNVIPATPPARAQASQAQASQAQASQAQASQESIATVIPAKAGIQD